MSALAQMEDRQVARAPSITLDHLVKLGACSHQTNLFRSLFGSQVEVTEETCVAVADKFLWDWAAFRLLTPEAYTKYNRIIDLARAEYERTIAPARAEYRRAEAAAWAEYERVDPAARAEYERTIAPARAEYERAKSAAFARAYAADQPATLRQEV